MEYTGNNAKGNKKKENKKGKGMIRTVLSMMGNTSTGMMGIRNKVTPLSKDSFKKLDPRKKKGSKGSKSNHHEESDLMF